MPHISPSFCDSDEFPPPLESATDSEGSPSLKSATNFLTFPSPSESAYDTDSKIEATPMVWVLPNSGSRLHYNYGWIHQNLDINRGSQRTPVLFGHWGKLHLVNFLLVCL